MIFLQLVNQNVISVFVHFSYVIYLLILHTMFGIQVRESQKKRLKHRSKNIAVYEFEVTVSLLSPFTPLLYKLKYAF